MTVVSFAINGPDIGILRLSGCAEETSIPYPALAHIIWIVLGIIISVLFLSLIVSFSRIMCDMVATYILSLLYNKRISYTLLLIHSKACNKDICDVVVQVIASYSTFKTQYCMRIS